MAQATMTGGSDQSFRSHAKQMLQTHPGKQIIDSGALLQCIEACFDCEQACIACADACMGEANPKMLARCIRLNEDCANICDATGTILSRQTEAELAVVRSIVETCALACKHCASECKRHASAMKHCEACADACGSCEEACKRLLDVA